MENGKFGVSTEDLQTSSLTAVEEKAFAMSWIAFFHFSTAQCCLQVVWQTQRIRDWRAPNRPMMTELITVLVVSG